MHDSDGNWDIKGRFEHAILENKPTDWAYEDNKYTLHLYVYLFTFI